MKVIGITGGAGTGKSYVCRCIQKHFGYPVIDSDSVARELMNPGKTAYVAVVDAFGKDILLPDAQIDRAKLAAIVFADEDKLAHLNSLTHPATIQEIKDRIESYRKMGIDLVFVESALADKANYRDFCDELWFVYASLRTRKKRLKKDRGYSEEKIRQVIANQSDDKAFMKYCNRTIVNSGQDEETLIKQLELLIREVLKG